MSESKEVERQEDKKIQNGKNSSSRHIREIGGRRYLDTDRHITHTDSWLERHFGSR